MNKASKNTTMKKWEFEMLPDVMTVDDMKNFLGIGRVQAYELIKKNPFHFIKSGRSIRFSKNVFLEWFEGKQAS